MVRKKAAAIVARREARERLARERAEQAERDRKNEADLIDYLVLEQEIATADSDRDAVIRSARERHQAVVQELKLKQAGCLARMSRRGEALPVIADRTGLTSREARRLIAAASDQQSEDISQAEAAPRSVRTVRRDRTAPATVAGVRAGNSSVDGGADDGAAPAAGTERSACGLTSTAEPRA
ncbi:hypothetical protein [Nocardia sp. BMG51109]|uniref:hypothetical protein n=1 Tax=Nocardia sp. BMG51109 TaxID=1056816 RepID=UPI0012ECA7DD|nr:hypothetical protein [Nocardia sp. BMG51109]